MIGKPAETIKKTKKHMKTKKRKIEKLRGTWKDRKIHDIKKEKTGIRKLGPQSRRARAHTGAHVRARAAARGRSRMHVGA